MLSLTSRKTGMVSDFGEVFTLGVRQAVPLLRAKGLGLAFDCVTGESQTMGNVQGLRGALHRLACLVIDTLSSGYVLFVAHAPSAAQIGRQGEQAPLGSAVAVTIGGVGLCSKEKFDEGLLRLGLVLEPAPDSERRVHFEAYGVCPLTGAPVAVTCSLSEGILVTLQAPAVIAVQLDSEQSLPAEPDAQSARAWLINFEEQFGRSCTRQLQRLGWAVAQFPSAQLALKQLRDHPDWARPELVIILESECGATADCFPPDSFQLPQAQLIYAVRAGSACLQAAEEAPAEHLVRVYPFSPQDLSEFTTNASGSQPASGLTSPTPLTQEDLPRILVVDDRPLNLLVAQGLVEAMGYTVETASSAREAIARCHSNAPDAILMDVQMPVLDGDDATREIRELQLRGVLPPFAIIGLTAGWSPSTRDECLASGMDECLAKPIDFTLLSRHLRQVCCLR